MGFSIQGMPLLVQTTATGQSLSCELCDWVEQLAPKTPLRGMVAIVKDHYRLWHSAVI